MAGLRWGRLSASRRGWEKNSGAGPDGSRSGRKRWIIWRGRKARARNVNDKNNREIAVNYQHILYEVSDKIATITLNRPDRMNAWTATMERDVRHAMEAAAGDDSVRVIVLTGAGPDMEALQAIDPSEIRRGESTPSFDMNRRADWQTRYAYYPAIPKP